MFLGSPGCLALKPFINYNRDIPQSSCLCEVCENVCLLAKGINKSCKLNLAVNPHDLVESFSCTSTSKACMQGDCPQYKPSGFDQERMEEVSNWNKVIRHQQSVCALVHNFFNDRTPAYMTDIFHIKASNKGTRNSFMQLSKPSSKSNGQKGLAFPLLSAAL